MNLGEIPVKEFRSIKGIGEAKAITLAAALELGRKQQATNILTKTLVSSSNDIAQFLRAESKDYAHEKFGIVFLNKSNKIDHFEFISMGGMPSTAVDPEYNLRMHWGRGHFYRIITIFLALYPAGRMKS
jgi:DNA repair protein RadC